MGLGFGLEELKKDCVGVRVIPLVSSLFVSHTERKHQGHRWNTGMFQWCAASQDLFVHIMNISRSMFIILLSLLEYYCMIYH